ncbi:MAG: RtcB family protein [bacterium]|nr:RtcB family protein [bacterium]
MVKCSLGNGKEIEVTPIKLNSYSYLIEKQEGMNAPVKIFADEKLFKKMTEDNCICQGVHVSTLPGIKGESIMLSDAHQGYGFSIGGVAAFDAENGIISPSGIGFDINCLPADAKVSLQYGTWLPIQSIEQTWNKVQLSFSDLETKSLAQTNVLAFMKKPSSGVLFQIKTKTGHTIRATDDHPFLTQDGMKKAEEISLKDKVLVYPFKGVQYEEPSNTILVSEDDLYPLFDRFGIKSEGKARNQILSQIRKLNILPLRYNSPQLPVLLKYLGYLFGDGNIYFSKNGHMHCWGKKEDLLTILDDLKSIGIQGANIYQRERNHKITTKYGVKEFSVVESALQKSGTGLFLILVALGCPYGKKTNQEYRVPQWIMDASLWQKRLFLASFFGAELSSPKCMNNGYNFFEHALGMNKLVSLKQNAIDFLQDIRRLLLDFDVTSSEPVHVEGYTYNGINGQTTGWRILIQTNSQNYLRFLETIGFEYHKEKQKKACLTAHFIRFKENILHIRARTRVKAKNMKNQLFPKQVIMQALIGEYVNERFIERSMYESTENTRIAYVCSKFEEYCSKYAVGDSGLAWTEIEKIRLVPYDGMVYDVTMNDTNHNFIAENFVVSNCGVRVLTTNLTREEMKPKILPLLDILFKHIPPGVGRKSQFKLTDTDLNEVLQDGAKWAVKKGYGIQEDLEFCEEEGSMIGADYTKVSKEARARGIGQLGTLGSGNHFIEIQYVAKIQNKEVAKTFGIEKEGQVVVMIHCGSRGLGHQVCSDYLRKIEDTYPEIMASVPDKDLAYAPIQSQLAKDYYGAMCAAANFAWTNRHLIGHQVRRSFLEVFGEKVELKTLYDVAHNIAKLEEHVIDGEKCKVYVHRKGATRAFGPGRKEIPLKYQKVGQPILLPGSMGTSSYVLVGTEGAMAESFGSTAHGAGRLMSRHSANKLWRGEQVKKDLEKKEIFIKAASWSGISEEAPGAYKDVDEVVAVSDAAGIGKIVCQLKPMGVVKG